MSTAFQVILTGAQETPPNTSTASGLGTVIFDDKAVTASYSFDIQGLDFFSVATVPGGTPTPSLLDDVTRTHFHNQQAGVAGSIVFGQIDPNPALEQDDDDLDIVPNSDGSWTISGVWETTDPPAPATSTFPEGATIADFAAVLGSAPVTTAVPLYFNVHTVQFPAGAIRGQLVAIADDIDNVVIGTNVVPGMTGNDTLDGSNGNDAIQGLTGNDTLNGGNGNDVLDGGGGNDKLTGGNGQDMLFGSVGNDDLDGGNGKDIVNGGPGDDLLTGGNGPDLFVFNAGFAGFGDDVITDFSNNDHIQFDDELFQSPEAVLMASQQVGEDTVITVGTNTVTLLGVQQTSLQAADFLIVA
jgi:serralysin